MSISEYNGGCVVAMAGKNCIGIACDTRFGLQNATVDFNFPKIFPVSKKILLGLAGFATDLQTIHSKVDFRTKMYKLRQEKEISPQAFAAMLSSLLYEHRFGPFFSEPIVAGIDNQDKPFLCSMDLIGAIEYTSSFVAIGTCQEALLGMCESLYKPDMEEEQLFETLSQCLLSAVDRDALSGWGGQVYIMTPKTLTIKELKARQD